MAQIRAIPKPGDFITADSAPSQTPASINPLRASTNAADAGVGAAQSGVSAVLGGGGQINAVIGNMNAQAGNVVSQGNAVNETAQKVKDAYAKLGPIAALLGGYGTDLWNQGNNLAGQAQSVFGQGDAMLNMDPNAGGLAGEYLKMFSYLSPDRYVSQAASDVQAAYQNQIGQAERDLSRRGVSASSGAFGALRQQMASLAATASAAAKTKARQMGIDEQKGWLGNIMNAANALFGVANATQQNALASQNAAVSAQGRAADVIAAQGQGYAQAGTLQQGAGQLFASAAGIYGDVGQLQNQYLSLVKQAYDNLSTAQFNKGTTYRSAVSVSNGGGGGMTVSGSGSDWVKSSERRDHSQSGSPWVTTWTNTKTGAQIVGDGLFDPNK